MKDLDPLLAALASSQELGDLLKKNKALLIEGLQDLGRRGIILDLEALPSEPYPLKTIFLAWLMSVNRERIANLQEPIVTYELVMRCPLWKVVPAPLRRVSLTTQGLNVPVKTVRQQTQVQGINSSRNRRKP